MKTLAVLSVLVGLAISAPAPQNGFQQGGSQPNGFPPNGFQGLETSGGMRPIDFNPEFTDPAISARSHHAVSNPVIVKKKTGYHVYRDSTEERAAADPHENCGKQVRVKLCDDVAVKSADLRRSTEHHLAPKDDVQDSIKLAKEAVESLQRDLKTIDHDTSGKSAQWKHGEPDKNLHEDIEAARVALEHAQMQQRNFGNLESINMHATTLRDSEALHALGKANTEEERLTQWKMAMENIQRNVEIARSIEDSFKAAEHHSSLLNSDAIDTTKFMRTNNQEHSANVHHMEEKSSSVTSNQKSFEEKTDKKITESKSEHHKTAGKTAEHFEEDMKSAASELVQSKPESLTENHHNSEMQPKLAHVSLNVKTPLLDPLLNSNNNNQHTKGSGIHLDASLRSAHKDDKMSIHDKSMKTNMMHSESTHKVKLNKEMSSKTLENKHHHTVAAKGESSNLKTFESHANKGHEHKTMHNGKSFSTHRESLISDIDLKQEKSALAESGQKDTMLKSAEHTLGLNDKITLEHNNLEASTSGLNTKLSMKSADNQKKEDAEQFVKKSDASLHSEMKVADNVELASEINLNAPLNVHLNQGIDLNTDQSIQGKTAELIKESAVDMEQARIAGHMKHAHHELGHYDHGYHGHGHLEHGHHEHGHGHIQHGYGHGHEHGLHGHGLHGHGYHGKAADFDIDMHPSNRVEMRDFPGKSAMENMLQWKHHDAARSAYGLGGYGAGGSSAVGVFPHAKVGGCGIPLLLSCSPSVVSGSLTKSHGYGGYGAAAPAYRNDEDSKFVNKRDIIKTKETSIKKVKDVTKPTATKDLEKKL